ncbi:hypothetical protein V6N12_055907 [Hibiscus sabdariffa]|uniref:Uncharacterized protein n=1 Tax=Hibiscus sabdariffa TaxID=183260 RepID=A0ABR2CQX7_9ROSI
MYVNPAELVVKGNIIWSDNSNDLSVLATTSLTQFKIVAVSLRDRRSNACLSTCFSVLLSRQSFRCFGRQRYCHSKIRNKKHSDGKMRTRACEVIFSCCCEARSL